MSKSAQRTARRKGRTRFAVKAAAHGRPRLSVFRSGKHIYAQIIADAEGKTLAAASSIECVSVLASFQIGVRQKPMRGAAMPRSIGTGGNFRTAPRNSAMSSSVRAMSPSVSSEGHCILMPVRLSSLKVGL